MLLHFLFFFFGYATASSNTFDVPLSTGIYRGVSTSQGIEQWLGIRYAQAPARDLRFKAPVPVPNNVNASVTVDASTFGNACPQPPATLGAPVAEDCLFLNVFRPGGTSDTAKLPVLVWIYGGSYTTGAASQAQYNPTRIVQHSASTHRPIVFVSINYRLNTFGFLSSASVPPQDLNAGLLDQQLAFKFVQDNIAAFGGDPAKVTIWGQSAGAGSVEAHLVYPAAGKPLFRAAIADSSTGPFKNSPPASTFDLPGKPFARFLANVGCPAGDGAIACLKGVPFETLLNASNTMISATLNQQLWQPSIAPGSMTPERASVRIRKGDFLKVPYLAGTNVNEGTAFSTTLLPLLPSTSSQNHALFTQFIRACVIDDSTLSPDVLSTFQTLFPQGDKTQGAPFNTGNELFDRAESWYTAQMFLGPRRLFFENLAKGSKSVWGYYFQEFIPGNDVTLGVSHASELQLLFGPLTGQAEVETDFADKMLDYWINFVNDMDPGNDWPKFSLEGRKLLQLKRGNVTVIPDDWDLEKTDFVNSPKVLDEFER